MSIAIDTDFGKLDQCCISSVPVDCFHEFAGHLQTYAPVLVTGVFGWGFGDIVSEIEHDRNLRQPTELFPEMATLDCGTCNFGDDVFENTMPMMRDFGKRMLENDIKPEYECFEMGHIDTILNMARKGQVPGAPMQFNFVLGVPGCTPATVNNLCWMVNAIPAGSTWTATGIGRNAFTLAAPAIVMGGNVRVGFEDNLYLERGVLAKSNGELVDKVVRLAKELGRGIATSEEARRILNLKPRI